MRDLFGRHVGADVARRALDGGVRLGGEARDIAVLFVDIIGSTTLAENRPPEEVVALLNDVFAAVVDAASGESGWVNKFEGDAALCVFGAPVGGAEHAACALRAARELREHLRRLGERHPGLDAGIGVSSGVAVAGNVGTEERYEYTVIGDPVNQAARLTDEAKHRLGRVLASEEAIARADGESRSWSVADEVLLRGRTDPTLVYEPAPSAGMRELA